jgi:hypothetical protein
MADIGALLADLAHTPHLPGARCRDEPQLFDKTIGGTAPRAEVLQARRDALAICRACPCLQACNAWVDTLPPWYRPRAVVAGRLHAWRDPPPDGMALDGRHNVE